MNSFAKLRWAPYVLLRPKEIDDFVSSHFQTSRKILFILGKGFDVRMNLAISKLVSSENNIDLTCLVIEFEEGKNSASSQYADLVKKNMDELIHVLNKREIISKKIKLWKGSGRKKRRIGDRGAASIIEADDLNAFTDIFVDISSLPRGIYFSLIGKLLYLIDHGKEKKKNLFVVVSENAELDANIIDEGIDEDLEYTYGFQGGMNLTSNNPIIWLPLLGEKSGHQIEQAYRWITPNEICILLPFPSRNPRRSDNLMIEYHQLLFDELRVEPQNIMYVSEQNPFEVYRKLCYTILNYNKSMSIIEGCRAVVSTFSSKLLSLGALLTAYEINKLPYNNEAVTVGILNVDSQGYSIQNAGSLTELQEKSEIFIVWLTGEPYEN